VSFSGVSILRGWHAVSSIVYQHEFFSIKESIMSKRNHNPAQSELFAIHGASIKEYHLKRLKALKATILSDMNDAERKALNHRRSTLAKARDAESWDEVKRACNRL
jgi:hypothetical protein